MGTGKIIVLAYPDTFVKMSDEWQCKLFPLVGLGTWDYVKAGHAAIVLIENRTGKASYYDFGRYVTPKGYGRVRSEITDVELKIPFKAKLIGNGPLENLNEFLLWLDANPQKTHGKGRLLASVCEDVNFTKAEKYIQELQQRGSIPYKAFKNEGSNCARFVTETILESTENKDIIKALNHNKRFTPSTVGNVEKASNTVVYEVLEGEIKKFNGSAFKENLTNYFHRKKKSASEEIFLPEIPKFAQKLEGIGSSAWFSIDLLDFKKNQYRIQRFNGLHQIDYVGIFISLDSFDIKKPFHFTYDSHCEFCHIIQNNKKIKLQRIKTCPEFSLLRKAQ